MTTKYPIPTPHVHAEAIKAWADGATLMYKNLSDESYIAIGNPTFYAHASYIVNPTCSYALAKIAELSGDNITNLYTYWLDGGEINCSTYLNPTPRTYCSPKPDQDPFNEFVNLLSNYSNITKKKRTVKQVLWVYADCFLDHNERSFRPEAWVNEDCRITSSDFCGYEQSYKMNQYNNWHKVPSCTKEVEVDDT